jgi:hypothetical protein
VWSGRTLRGRDEAQFFAADDPAAALRHLQSAPRPPRTAWAGRFLKLER